MPEKSLPLHLNGEEIIEAVVAKIRERMRKDCFLNSTTAYDWFRAEVSIHVLMNDSGRRPEVSVNVQTSEGEMPTADDSVKVAESSFKMQEAPPNQVRIESNQPVPVLSTGGDGKAEVKRASYRGAKGA